MANLTKAQLQIEYESMCSQLKKYKENGDCSSKLEQANIEIEELKRDILNLNEALSSSKSEIEILKNSNSVGEKAYAKLESDLIDIKNQNKPKPSKPAVMVNAH